VNPRWGGVGSWSSPNGQVRGEKVKRRKLAFSSAEKRVKKIGQSLGNQKQEKTRNVENRRKTGKETSPGRGGGRGKRKNFLDEGYKPDARIRR